VAGAVSNGKSPWLLTGKIENARLWPTHLYPNPRKQKKYHLNLRQVQVPQYAGLQDFETR
jgi:hypothetical protein